MIYQIENKYYIRVAPMKYTEIKFVLKNNDVAISTTQNRIIANASMKIKEINFQNEKENIKASLLNETKEIRNTNSSKGSKYRRRG